jgi:hypothetical protein
VELTSAFQTAPNVVDLKMDLLCSVEEHDDNDKGYIQEVAYNPKNLRFPVSGW